MNLTQNNLIMKQFSLLLIAVLSIIGCSEDDSGSVELNGSLEENLIHGSPWNFARYEINDVLNSGTQRVSDAEIQNYIQSYHETWNGTTLTFNEDGTGSSNRAPNFTWSLVEDDVINIDGRIDFQITLQNSEVTLRGNGNVDFVDEIDGTTKSALVDEQIVYN